LGDSACEQLLQHLGAAEENFALIGVIPEERSLGKAGPLGDLRNRRLLEAALAVELERRLLEAAASVWLPPGHAGMIVMAATDILLLI
jgi:hypothetical protein